jgi:dihydroxyacetone kinase-like predicted kinase
MSVEEGRVVVVEVEAMDEEGEEEEEEEDEEANLVTLVDRVVLTLSKRELVEGLLEGEEIFLGRVTREGDADREGSSVLLLEGIVAVVVSRVFMR